MDVAPKVGTFGLREVSRVNHVIDANCVMNSVWLSCGTLLPLSSWGCAVWLMNPRSGVTLVWEPDATLSLLPISFVRRGDYRWSRFRGNAGLVPRGWLVPHDDYLRLGGAGAERIEAYHALFRTALDLADVTALRLHVNTSCALGDARFQALIAAMVSRRAHVMPVGRPRRIAGKWTSPSYPRGAAYRTMSAARFTLASYQPTQHKLMGRRTAGIIAPDARDLMSDSLLQPPHHHHSNPMSSPCPICATPAPSQHPGAPYWMCPSCDCWFQSPLPPKTYEAAHETDAAGHSQGHMMSDHDKEVNRKLAEHLFRQWLGATPAKTLDVGSKYPFLAHCLRELGCESFGMDNIAVVPDYARALGVPMLMADFEQITDTQIREWTATDRFALITLVHVFEHMYDPLGALRKLRRLVADDGVLFVRLPDHRVRGFEQDMSPGHFAIHPYFHALGSMLELLVQARDLFSVAHTSTMEGAGQRDLILRPLARKPIIYAGLIVKNEERDLPRCLKSIESVVDGAVIVDTGSTDRTLEVATTTIDKPVHTQVYTGASRQDEHGDWKLWDFGKARNVFVDEIERRGADYVLWMDADDELLTPVNLRRATYWSQYEVYGVQVESLGTRWTHHRLWQAGRGIRFEGRCHEYPTVLGRPTLVLNDSVIRHDQTAGTGETGNARNLRIMLEEFAENPTPRTAFYLGGNHKDAGRYAEAVQWYARRIELGLGFRDEWLFAYLYKARCEHALGDDAATEKTLLEAVSKERSWAEFWMELSFVAYRQKRYWQVIGFALQAVDAPIPATLLWREPNMYTDQPLRMISWAYEHLGDNAQALAWGLKARAVIGSHDREWEQRIARLSGGGQPSPESHVRAKLAVNRPGAFGDILMTLNLIPLLRAKYPGHQISYFCNPDCGKAVADILRAAAVDAIEDSAEFFARKGEFAVAFNLIGYPLHEGYPDKPMRQHLLLYFGEELGFRLDGLPTLRLPCPARPAGPPDRYATLQTRAGWSHYKNWPIERWAGVLEALPEIPVYQIGKADEAPVPGARHEFMGAPFQTAIQLVANADLHLGIDSFANHLTHYEWETDVPSKWRRVPGVILWGSTQVSAAGYPENTNISLGLPCQPCFREDPAISKMPRGVCINPPGQTYDTPRHACMYGITVEQVTDAVRRLWTKE